MGLKIAIQLMDLHDLATFRNMICHNSARPPQTERNRALRICFSTSVITITFTCPIKTSHYQLAHKLGRAPKVSERTVDSTRQRRREKKGVGSTGKEKKRQE